jgi:hypothetical protein
MSFNSDVKKDNLIEKLARYYVDIYGFALTEKIGINFLKF